MARGGRCGIYMYRILLHCIPLDYILVHCVLLPALYYQRGASVLYYIALYSIYCLCIAIILWLGKQNTPTFRNIREVCFGIFQRMEWVGGGVLL